MEAFPSGTREREVNVAESRQGNNQLRRTLKVHRRLCKTYIFSTSTAVP